VQGAGLHHNPSPGPAGKKFVYGHVWVALAWLARHPRWETLSLPLRALLTGRFPSGNLKPPAKFAGLVLFTDFQSGKGNSLCSASTSV
jgi:hypothetical protein